MVSPFSFIILTLNEGMHLPRLLDSIRRLEAPVFILDSGSTDNTADIVRADKATIAYNRFQSHPLQWAYALNHFDIKTPWIIGLDADQFLSDELFKLLETFKDENIPEHVEGIYFNRKNYFKGKWIRHGGYFPKYMLKMFRTGRGESDLSEMLDHRFKVNGNTLVWRRGFLIEENLKESVISFWIDKHNRYSDLVAKDEFEKSVQPIEIRNLLPGSSPDRRVASQKSLWRRLPLIFRPFIYFFYRYFILVGFLDGYRGFIFHFLHAFWFRLIIDVKIRELRDNQRSIK